MTGQTHEKGRAIVKRIFFKTYDDKANPPIYNQET